MRTRRTSHSARSALSAHQSPPSPSSPAPLRLVLGTRLTPLVAGHHTAWDRADWQVTLTGDVANAHRLVVGVTGSGKSDFQASLIAQLINQGVSCVVIDPHDLCERVLRLLRALGFYRDQRAFDRVVWIPFGQPNASPAYNVHDHPYTAHDIARHTLLAFQRAWPALANGSAPVVENMLLASSYALARRRFPITALGRLLTDASFRNRLLAGLQDEEVIRFFRRFDASGRRATLLSESTLRRAFLMTFSPAVRYSLGQPRNHVQLRERLERGVSVLLDLSGLDEDSTRLLGCLLMVDLEVVALSRRDSSTAPAAAHLRPIHAFVDEAPVFLSQSATAVEHLLTQSRKFGVSVTLAAQYFAQARKLQAALQNALLIAFRLGQADAEWAAPSLFAPDPYRLKERPDMRSVYMSLAEQRAAFEQELMTLPAREAFARVDGATMRLRTVLLPPTTAHSDDAIEEQMRRIKATYMQSLLTPHDEIADGSSDDWLPAASEVAGARTRSSGQSLGSEPPLTPPTTSARANGSPPATGPPRTPSADQVVGAPSRRRRVAPLSDERTTSE